MKKLYSIFMALFAATVISAQGIFESQAVVNTGGSDVWYNLNSSNTGNSAFDGHYFGTFNNSQTLKLASYIKTWEPSSGPAVMRTNFYYRVYVEGTTPPSTFSDLTVTSFTDLGYDGSSHNKAWGVSSFSNILSGLASGKYVVEIYMTANTAADNTGSNYYDSNNSNNYKGYFTIDNGTLAVNDIAKSGKSIVAEGKLFTAKKGDINLTVYDFSGKVVKTMTAKADGNAIDLNVAQRGLYMVKVSDATSSEVVKFVK